MSEKLEIKYGLPEKVIYCKRCVMSNQRPASTPEFKHAKKQKHVTLHVAEDGICDACRFAEQKEEIDWTLREQELMKLLDKHRRNDGHYDCVVPGSGGKDSIYASHILKYKYGMNPLTVTWPPIIYTDVGLKNFRNWIDIGGFDNISFNYNGIVHALLTRLAIENLLHPFQPFIFGQRNMVTHIAKKFKIPLIFMGEPQAERGGMEDELGQYEMLPRYWTKNKNQKILMSGLELKELKKHLSFFCELIKITIFIILI